MQFERQFFGAFGTGWVASLRDERREPRVEEEPVCRLLGWTSGTRKLVGSRSWKESGARFDFEKGSYSLVVVNERWFCGVWLV
jgi:hypothetical protein